MQVNDVCTVTGFGFGVGMLQDRVPIVTSVAVWMPKFVPLI